MKVFLIGFMGSGKSYIGKGLSEALGCPFIDLDKEIEKGEKKSIPEIFMEGETHFRTLEAEYLRQTKKLENAVISTGGGAPCFNDNMSWMNQNGITLYLDTSRHLLIKRLSKNPSKRPLLLGLNGMELEGFIDNKLRQRMEFYNQASLWYKIDKDDQDFVTDLVPFFLRF
jgi:shikimate kinase